MTRKLGITALCLAVAACGGDAPHVNAAAQRTFTYGAPVAASPDLLAGVDAPLADALSFQATQDTSAAAAFTDPSQLTTQLFGSPDGIALDGTATRTALTMARQPAASYLTTDLTGFDNPACVTQAAGSVTFKACTVTFSDTQVTGHAGIDGTVTASSGGALDWNLTIDFGLTSTDPAAQGATVSASLHRSGHLSLTPGTIDGELLHELSITASAAGRSETLGVDESVELKGLTYQTAPTRCITSGSVEVARVWTRRPSSSTADLRDRGAVITWTGCGFGTIAFSNG